MILGNIVSKIPFKKEKYYTVSKKVNLEVPNLIIGWELAKNMFEEDFRFNSSQINEKAYWTTKPRTDRFKMQNDIKVFKSNCINYRINQYKYVSLDPFQKIKKVPNFEDIEYIIIDKYILYIFSKKMIYGLSLKYPSLLNHKYIEKLKRRGVHSPSISPEFLHLLGYKKYLFDNFTFV